jgi:hypothetical protein
MSSNLRNDPEEEGTELEPQELCTVCRQSVPVRQIIMMMTRPVCLNCAATFYEDDEEGE